MRKSIGAFVCVASVLFFAFMGPELASAASDGVGQVTEEHADAQPAAGGADTAPAPDGNEPTALTELERRVEILAAEIEALRSGEEPAAEVSPERARALGLAPSAATLYRQARGVSIAGYGEALLQRESGADESGDATDAVPRLDMLRAILYTGYRFNERFLFNSEIEIEHADEVSVEFAYVDYLAHPRLGLRGGMLLVPMGLVNEFHEPTVFLGARRPETETRILPSTWREVGAGLHGSAGRIEYRAYVVNGLSAAGFSAGGLRGGRQKGSQALARHVAFVGRLDVSPSPGVLLGASLYHGGSGQGAIEVEDRSMDVPTTIFELHGQARLRGLDLRGLYARAAVGDAAELNRALALEGGRGVAEVLQGGYLQLGYDVLSRLSAGRLALTVYGRYEMVDTQASMPAGFERDQETRVTLTTLGVELKPIAGVVVKADYQLVSNDARTGRDQLNVLLGYAF